MVMFLFDRDPPSSVFWFRELHRWFCHGFYRWYVYSCSLKMMMVSLHRASGCLCCDVMWWLFSFVFHVSGSCAARVHGKTLHARIALTALRFFQGRCQPFWSWLIVFPQSGPLMYQFRGYLRRISLCFSQQFIVFFWHCCKKTFLVFYIPTHFTPLFLSSFECSSLFCVLSLSKKWPYPLQVVAVDFVFFSWWFVVVREKLSCFKGFSLLG